MGKKTNHFNYASSVVVLQGNNSSTHTHTASVCFFSPFLSLPCLLSLCNTLNSFSSNLTRFDRSFFFSSSLNCVPHFPVGDVCFGRAKALRCIDIRVSSDGGAFILSFHPARDTHIFQCVNKFSNN